MRASAPAVLEPRGLGRWLATVDHKRIGELYLVSALAFFLLGGLAALLVRVQLAFPSTPPLSAELYNQVFTTHATMMIFLFVIPIGMGALGSYFVPLLIGARNVALPGLNAFAYWLMIPAGLVILSGFLAGGAADTGLTALPPLSVRAGFGQSLWAIGVIMMAVSSLLLAINLLATIVSLRAPGITANRLSPFAWNVGAAAFIQMLILPLLILGLLFLLMDRHFGTQFYTAGGRGIVLYKESFDLFTHPAVYAMVLPFFGVVSEIIPVFSRKPLFSYRAEISSTVAIAVVAAMVWLHQVAVLVGLPSLDASLVAGLSVLVGIPMALKLFNWVATLWGGHLTFQAPLLFAVGVLSMILVGGLAGAISGLTPVDVQLRDTYWAVAHLHYVLFGGAVFGVFAALYYWFPKITGRLYSEHLARWHFWLMMLGFNLTFFPMYILGVNGMQRRIASYPLDTGFLLLNQVQTLGAFVLAYSVGLFLWNVWASARKGAPAGRDPWVGNTLEWLTSSPPPMDNFDTLPLVRSERPLWDLRHGSTRQALAESD